MLFNQVPRSLKQFNLTRLGSLVPPLQRGHFLSLPDTRKLWFSSRARYLSTLGLFNPFTKVVSNVRQCSQVEVDALNDALNDEDVEGVLDESTGKLPHDVETDRVCSGCGSLLQSTNPKRRGFIPEEKLSDPSTEVQSTQDEEMEEVDCDIENYFPETLSYKKKLHSVSPLTCQRCFSLRNYNNALHITLKSDDYLKYLSSLKKTAALIVLVIDVTDFPSCIFPKLDDIVSSRSSVLIVANKIDLFPKKLPDGFFNKLENHIIKEIGIRRRTIVGIRFVSAKKGTGVPRLADEIGKKWGNRGDVYLLGSTNVGKSSLFNKLLTQLCGSRPGELNTDTNLLAPKATISLWPGTTLGLLSFPMLSTRKRMRLLQQQKKRGEDVSTGIQKYEECDDEVNFLREIPNTVDYPEEEKRLALAKNSSHVEIEDMLDELGLRKRRRSIGLAENHDESLANKLWLHDTPGAINDAQLINHLTTKELTLGLPKVPLKPKTFILRPGQCIFLGGLARLDYIEGLVSAYFTVFTWPYLRLHATKVENAARLYERHITTPNSYFMLPIHQENRCNPFPPLEPKEIHVKGIGWKKSVADIVLSSAGWVAVTFGGPEKVTLRAHTPNGKGINVREPSLFDEVVNLKGKRERYGNRCAYKGREGRRK